MSGRVPKNYITDDLRRAPHADRVFPAMLFKPLPKNRIVGATTSERIKNRNSVHDFVSQYVELDRSGKSLCPFHDDHGYSFGLNEQGNYRHCFVSCGGGSVIDFWTRWRKLNGQDDSFTATITNLANMLL